MEKNEISAKFKNQINNMEKKDDFLNIQKEKILSLRKRNLKKRNIHRILEQREIKAQEKYKIYDFHSDEFTKISYFFKNKNDIYSISTADLIKDDNFLFDIAKYWLYSMYKVSSKGKYEEIKEKIINNLNDKKMNFLIDTLNKDFDFNNNNLDAIRNQIKVKYTACSLLINIIYDTNKFNDILNEKMNDIYNFIFKLIYIYQDTKEFSYLVLITHYQWLMNNYISEHGSYKSITKKKLNFPKLIQSIFDMNNSELYLNNIRMLIIYLEHQTDPKSFYQYHSFIKDLENIIYYSIQNNDIDLLKESFRALKLLLKSEANCKLLIENNQYIKLLSQIINGFTNIQYCYCCLTKLVKNDENNIINTNYQIHKTLLDIILNKIPSNKEVLQHSLKILRLIINNKNGFNLLNYLISGENQNFLVYLQKIYFEKPSHLLIQSEVFNFLQTVFNLANNSYKNNLINNELHNFALNCLESSYQEFISENKDNSSYNKLIIQILKLLATILDFGNSDLNLKIKLKNCCEEKNIYHILVELNYCKNSEIQDLVQYLNENFFEGYENEEVSEDE